MNRRQFIGTSAAMAGFSLTSFGRSPARLENLGVNLFSLPKMLETDFEATMKMIDGLGYREIEFYGPYDFSSQEDKDRWRAVTPNLGFSGSGFFGRKATEVRALLDELGLTTPSLHTNLNSLQTAMGPLAEAAHAVGAKYVTLPSAKSETDLDGYKRQADEFNKIGKEAARHGLKFAYHNHGNGLKPLGDTVPFDLLMNATEHHHVCFEMDIFWMTAGGVNVTEFLDKYPGRFKLMHVKDMSKRVTFSGDGGDSKQWIELFPFVTDAGSGVLHLVEIIRHARKAGVEHFIVERDLAPEPEKNLGASIAHLSQLEV